MWERFPPAPNNFAREIQLVTPAPHTRKNWAFGNKAPAPRLLFLQPPGDSAVEEILRITIIGKPHTPHRLTRQSKPAPPPQKSGIGHGGSGMLIRPSWERRAPFTVATALGFTPDDGDVLSQWYHADGSDRRQSPYQETRGTVI